MRKRLFVIILVSLMLLCGCGREEKAPQLQETQMRSICELATLECYYHNVAKFKEEDAEGFWIWKKDKHFWIEYTGVVKLGVDASKVRMEVKEDQVTITIPNARVLSCSVDEQSIQNATTIMADGSADVNVEDTTQAYAAAQENMMVQASGNSSLLMSAQQRAQDLLEDYVNNIGEVLGVEYEIEWEYLEE